MRCKDLKQFLQTRNLPLVVCLSEDATRLTGRLQYDQNTNQIVGFVLPMDKQGMPIPLSFPATSAQVIEKYFENEKIASSLYTIIAQPLQNDAPCFCLCLYGTDNKFTAEDVLHRWDDTICELKKSDITVAGISSDGDSRLLKAMRIKSQSSTICPDFSNVGQGFYLQEFHAATLPPFLTTQDTVHIGAKLKTRLLKPSIVLPIGNFLVSCGHIHSLIKTVSKDKHQLTPSDLFSKDKMNLKSVPKICDPIIARLLFENVPGSEGTAAYLKVMYFIIQSYLSVALIMTDRIYYLWYAVFFLRYWRAWIVENKFSVTSNFITTNTYLCVELNAHCLLNAIFQCIKTKSCSTFLPWQFGSQQCESFFRNLRSMTSTYSTVVNCSLLEAIYRIKRLQFLADISVMDFGQKGQTFFFPRTRHLNTSYECQDTNLSSPTPLLDSNCSIPSLEQVQREILKAKNDAYNHICSLGAAVAYESENSVEICNIDLTSDYCTEHDADDSVSTVIETDDLPSDLPNTWDSDILNDSVDTADQKILLSLKGPLQLPNCNTEKVENEKSPFTVVKDSLQNEYVVRKTSLCWFLSSNNSRLSTDRLERVKHSEFKRDISFSIESDKDNVTELEEICIGDWCMFKKEDSDSCLLGLILGFAYPSGKTWKSKEFSGNFARIHGNRREIGVLCQWFDIGRNGYLNVVNGLKHGYINIENYRLSVPQPLEYNGYYYIRHDVLIKIQNKVSVEIH